MEGRGNFGREDAARTARRVAPERKAMPRRVFDGGILLLLMLACLFWAERVWADTLRIGGTGSALPAMRLVAGTLGKEAEDLQIAVVPNLGSSGGLRALAADAIELAVISRPLTAEEKRLPVAAIRVATTPFVVATGASRKAPVSPAAIADIYAGRVTTWPDGTPVRIVLRPGSDSDTQQLKVAIPGAADRIDDMLRDDKYVVAVTDQEAADFIQRIPGGIGPTSLALVLGERRPLVVHGLDGASPYVEGRANPAYRHQKPLYLVAKTPVSAPVRRLLEFLRSAAGTDILLRAGYLPAR